MLDFYFHFLFPPFLFPFLYRTYHAGRGVVVLLFFFLVSLLSFILFQFSRRLLFTLGSYGVVYMYRVRNMEFIIY